LALPFLCLLALGTTGCLTYERQTMVFAFPKDSQEVKGLFLYEGIRVWGSSENDLNKAKKELASFTANEQEFFLGSFLWRVSLAPAEDDKPSTTAYKTLFRKHLTVKNGAFFLNKEGKLCLSQALTLRDRDKFVKELNALLTADMAADVADQLADPEKRGVWDEESLRMIQQACTKQFQWVRLEPGRVSCTLLATPGTISRLKREVLAPKVLDQMREALREDKKAPEDPEKVGEQKRQLLQHIEVWQMLAGFLADNPWSFDQRADHFTLSLGVGDGQPIRLTALCADSAPYRKVDDELVAFSRTLKVEFKKDVTADGLIADFLKATDK
jgi:hypothetical protein